MFAGDPLLTNSTDNFYMAATNCLAVKKYIRTSEKQSRADLCLSMYTLSDPIQQVVTSKKL